MKKFSSIFIMLLLFSVEAFAQKETKFYWNEKWESVTKKENPSYYSLISEIVLYYFCN